MSCPHIKALAAAALKLNVVLEDTDDTSLRCHTCKRLENIATDTWPPTNTQQQPRESRERTSRRRVPTHRRSTSQSVDNEAIEQFGARAHTETEDEEW